MTDYKKWVSSSRRSLWRTIGLFFILMGPGIITSNVDNDAGGITTYSLAGARIRIKTDLVPDPNYDRPDRDPGDVRSHGRGNG